MPDNPNVEQSVRLIESLLRSAKYFVQRLEDCCDHLCDHNAYDHSERVCAEDCPLYDTGICSQLDKTTQEAARDVLRKLKDDCDGADRERPGSSDCEESGNGGSIPPSSI